MTHNSTNLHRIATTEDVSKCAKENCGFQHAFIWFSHNISLFLFIWQFVSAFCEQFTWYTIVIEVGAFAILGNTNLHDNEKISSIIPWPIPHFYILWCMQFLIQLQIFAYLSVFVRFFLTAFRIGSLREIWTNCCISEKIVISIASWKTLSILASKTCRPLTIAITSINANRSSLL